MSQSRTNAIQAERQARIEKANLLREKGYEPYSAEATRQMTLQQVKDNFESLKEKAEPITLSGRIHSLRLSGKIGFTTMVDYSTGIESGFQFLFKKDDMTGDLGFDDFKALADRGDFIEATGVLDLSQRGEPSLFVHEFKILTKSLRSFPEKLDDIEQKYRKRYIDMNLDPEVREMFVKKSKFWKATRDYMIQNGFLEVYAPTMEHTTGGAEAAPFSTYHNALDEDYYLRISSELFLKRYIVGGYEKVFDLDKNFRNEGIDDEHLQEYYQMEFYWAYADFDDLINYTENLLKYVIKETFGTLELSKSGEKVSWDGQWSRMDYYEFVEKFAGIKLQEYDTVEKLRELADELGLKYKESDGYGRLVDLIYKKTARPKCISPVWLINVPVELSPLAKRNPKDPSKTLRAQLIAYGSELTNGYAELNDSVDQLNRFEEQQRLREAGDDEAMMPDYDFVEALEYGMPPTVGFAYSERLFSVLYEKPIRETTAFPMVKKVRQRVVTICGSMQFREEFVQVKNMLEEKGVQVITPDLGEDIDYSKMSDEEIRAKKGGFIQKHFKNIDQSDIVLIWNKEKKDIPGYIGGNTLIEMAYAFGVGKEIYLLNDIPEMAYSDEIKGMSPVVINGDLRELPL